MNAQAREQLLDLLRRNAVSRGDFVLSSGRRSSYYLDARLVTLSAIGSRLVGELMYHMIRESDADAVGGLAVGADPIVTSVALTSSGSDHPIDGLIIRNQPKEHGAGRRIEGPWREGIRVAVVDDALTTGGSSLEAAAAIEEAGMSVSGFYFVVDREEGGRQAIEATGLSLRALFTARELLEEVGG